MTTIEQLESKVEGLTVCIDAISATINQRSSKSLSSSEKNILLERQRDMRNGNFYSQEEFTSKLQERGLI